jgi:gliding motility-associated lipoprotein GldH
MHKYLGVVAGLLLLVSCDKNLVYSEYRSTDRGIWRQGEAIKFQFNAPDTTSRHQLFFIIRNDDQFPYSNLFLIATMNFPDGKVVKDTLEYEMARPDGSWLGKGAGSIKENALWYKENIVFPFNGVYTLELVHAMRKNGSVDGIQNLPGITDIGLEIKKSNE